MFTGIVTDVGEVRSVKPRADNLHRITIACDYPRAELIDGASIACSGVCLTVVGTGEEDGRAWFAVDAAAETLRADHGRALAARRARQSRAPAEDRRRTGRTSGRRPCRRPCGRRRARGHDRHLREMARFALRAPPDLARFIAAKGSVALDGVSLTVNDSRRRHIFGADHPAHAGGDDARRAGRRATTSTSKSTPWRATRRG